MGTQRVAQTTVTGCVRVEAVFGEELLAARAKGLVGESIGADSNDARGWVGGSGLAALISGAAEAQHRLEGCGDTRNDRKIDQSAHQGLDTCLIECRHHSTDVAFEASERRGMDRVVRADGDHRNVRWRRQHPGELTMQYVGDARSADREPREVKREIELPGGVRHEDFAGVIKAGTGQRTVTDDRNPNRLRRVDSGVPVVAGEIEIIEVGEGRMRGSMRLPPAASDHGRNCECRPPGSHKTTHRGDLPTKRQ